MATDRFPGLLEPDALISGKARQNLESFKTNPYPGRGIVIGASPSGEIVQIYWIMGRSENSRNRIFVPEAHDIRTQAAVPGKMKDPSLIIYYPIRVTGDVHIVSNGDQTDTVRDSLEHDLEGKDIVLTSFKALCSRRYEPDPPHLTPRITGIVDLISSRNSLRNPISVQTGDDAWAYAFSILKSVAGHESSDQRHLFLYDRFIRGIGHLLHTYEGDEERLPTFSGEPILVSLEDDPAKNLGRYWGLLDTENRISMYVKHIDPLTGRTRTALENRYTPE